jgi:hypothetical protein
VKKYKNQSKLYLSWDAASWHSSKILKDYVRALNTLGTPKLIFAPLPSCTQWLNVIESVFGGLARAVIHNSDYENLDACKVAIDLHFASRNQHFQLNPKRAGNKIWGKETVKAKFDETHITRNKSHMGYK